MVRRTNQVLVMHVATFLRRLTASGLARDKALAEDFIKDLDGRLCPHPSDKYAQPDEPAEARTVRHAGERKYGPMNFRDGPRPALPAHPEYPPRRR